MSAPRRPFAFHVELDPQSDDFVRLLTAILPSGAELRSVAYAADTRGASVALELAGLAPQREEHLVNRLRALACVRGVDRLFRSGDRGEKQGRERGRQRLAEAGALHPQRREDVALDIGVEIDSRRPLDDVAGERRGVVGACRRRAAR